MVTVGDDGGSSGRLRAERGGLPPGDLRQALAALAADQPAARRTAALLQHRFAAVGDPDPLAGHAVGNLVLCGLMEHARRPGRGAGPRGARWSARWAGCCRCPATPVGIEAEVRGGDPARPDETVTVRGQHAVAVTTGHGRGAAADPARAAGLPAGAGRDRRRGLADLRPGQLVHECSSPPAGARSWPRRSWPARPAGWSPSTSPADNETLGLSVADHLAALRWYLPDLRIDAVLADAKAVGEPGTGRIVAAKRSVRGWSSPRLPSPTAAHGMILRRWALHWCLSWAPIVKHLRITAQCREPVHEVTTQWR